VIFDDLLSDTSELSAKVVLLAVMVSVLVSVLSSVVSVVVVVVVVVLTSICEVKTNKNVILTDKTRYKMKCSY
jgi:hypothetical protein